MTNLKLVEQIRKALSIVAEEERIDEEIQKIRQSDPGENWKNTEQKTLANKEKDNLAQGTYERHVSDIVSSVTTMLDVCGKKRTIGVLNSLIWCITGHEEERDL